MMISLKSSPIVILIALAAIVSILSCSDEIIDDNRVFVNAIVAPIQYAPSPYYMSLYVNSLASKPTIYCNDEELSYSYNNQQYVVNAQLPEISEGDSLRIELEYELPGGGLGYLSAMEICPAKVDTAFYTETLHVDQDLIFSWEPSANAQKYQLYIRWSYRYTTDTSSDSIQYSNSMTANLTETSYSFSADSLFPNLDDISSLFDGWVSVLIRSYNGPVFEGELGNFTGDGRGFLIVRSEEESFSITIEEYP